MSPQDRIARLESLLERVRRNAALPRVPVEMAAPEIVVSSAVESEGNGEAAIIVDDATSGVMPIAESVAGDLSEPFAEVEVEELELSEEEIVDLTEAEELGVEEIPPVAAASASVVDDMTLDWEEVDEPPASSRRPIAATSMDEALAEATEQIEMDEGREIPLKTPPPESGPQEAPPIQQAFVPPPVPAEPEPLEEPEMMQAQPRELAEPPAEAVQLVEADSVPPLEVAEAELEPIPAAEMAPESGEISPDVIRRPELVASAPSAYVAAVRGFQPATFVELLDASLSLGK